MFVRVCVNHSVMSNSCDPMDCSSPDSSAHRDSPGKNTGVGCLLHTADTMYKIDN